MEVIRLDVPILYMSGYPGLEVVERGLIAPDAPFIEKPFTAASLAQSVRGLLTGIGRSPREEPA